MTTIPAAAPAPAAAHPAPAAGSAATPYLTFDVAGEPFAMAISSIREIIEYRGVTEVPMMPPSVRGVINLRGAVVPVLDLAARFGRAPRASGKRNCIVILETAVDGEAQLMGAIVDAVSEVLDIAGDQIEAAPAFGAGVDRDDIVGMAKVRGRFAILLDAERVLAVHVPPADKAAPSAAVAA